MGRGEGGRRMRKINGRKKLLFPAGKKRRTIFMISFLVLVKDCSAEDGGYFPQKQTASVSWVLLRESTFCGHPLLTCSSFILLTLLLWEVGWMVTKGVNVPKKKDLHKAWRAWGNTDTGLWAGDRSSLSEVAESISNWETGQESLLSVFLHEVLLAHLTPHLEGITQFVISVFRGCWPLLWSTEGCVSCKALFPSHLQFGYYSHFFLNWAFPWLSVTI